MPIVVTHRIFFNNVNLYLVTEEKQDTIQVQKLKYNRLQKEMTRPENS